MARSRRSPHALRVSTLLLLLAPLPPARAAETAPIFVDATAAWGLDFVHANGMSGALYFPEIMGAGAALLDYDGDGDLDLYLVQGGPLPPAGAPNPAGAPDPAGADGTPRDRLFRNDLSPAAGGEPAVRFVDVTAASGIDETGYGMGVATGDLDGDGWVDLFVANLGADRLFVNRGDGSFADRTAESGASDDRWSVAGSFADYDGDGLLDLYVVNYVDFSFATNPVCFAESTRRDWCGPSTFQGAADRLLRNRGGGRFEDVSTRAGIAAAREPGLGVLAGDFDGDGRTDFYVANDGRPNQLWLARGDGTFRDEALLAGVAVNREGRPEGSMGITAGDLDGDGDEELFVTNITSETHALYSNLGGGLFDDRRIEAGLAAPTLPSTGFGTGFLDFDNDGRLDLFLANGAVRTLEEQARAGDPLPLRQRHQLFRNLGGGRLEEVSARAGEPFARAEVGRGVALGDADNDGDPDLVVANNHGPARLLLDSAGQGRSWLGVVTSAGGPFPTAVTVRAGEGAPLLRRPRTDGSYASANDPRVIFGLGERREGVTVRVEGAGRAARQWRGVPPGVYVVVP